MEGVPPKAGSWGGGWDFPSLLSRARKKRRGDWAAPTCVCARFNATAAGVTTVLNGAYNVLLDYYPLSYDNKKENN